MVSLYIHIPFCIKKCLFCSFVVAVGQTQRTDEYVHALAAEAARHRGARLSTVYLGGGTPTFLNERQLGFLVENVRKNFDVSGDLEWTIEANPEGLDASKAKFLRSLGFNRLSIGVQSFDDRYLKFLGRNHDRALALRSYAEAREAGFTNINLDLMFGFPGQTMEELTADLQILSELRSEHVSLYNLTIEENSRFHARQMKLDDDDHLAQQYILICESLDACGLRQYEVSNFSRPGFESKHNNGYWDGSSYIGIGVGAHGFLNNRRYWNVPRLQDYLARTASGAEAVEGSEELTPQTILMERILFGLRKNEGICLVDIERQLSLKLDEGRSQMMRQWVKDGFLVSQDNRLRTTMKGRLVLDELSSRLI